MQQFSHKKVVGGQRPVQLGASRALSARESRDPLVGVQQTIGNHGLLRRSGEVIQAKLKIGAPNDKYEQEADRVAEMVMRMPEPKVQRQAEDDEEEKELIQMKPVGEQITSLVQRQAEVTEEEEEFVQIKAEPGQTPRATSNIEAQVTPLRGCGQPLSQSARAFFEPRFGYNFHRVRIHMDRRTAETVQVVNAKAFTVGKDIAFDPAQYAPSTESGKKLLAHELVHVIQQDVNQRTSPSINSPRIFRSPKASLQPDLKPHSSSKSKISLREQDLLANVWLRYGSVGVEELTGDRNKDFDILARAILGLRVPLDPRTRRDPLLGRDPDVTRKDPRYLALFGGPVARAYDAWDRNLQKGIPNSPIRRRKGESVEVTKRRLSWLYASYGILDWPNWYISNIKPSTFMGLRVIWGLHKKSKAALASAEQRLVAKIAKKVFVWKTKIRAFGGGYNARGWRGKLGAHSFGMAFDLQAGAFNIEVRGAPGIAWATFGEGKNHIFAVKWLTGFDVYQFAKQYSQFEFIIRKGKSIPVQLHNLITKQIKAAEKASSALDTALENEKQKIKDLGLNAEKWQVYGSQMLKEVSAQKEIFPPVLKSALKDPKMIRTHWISYLRRLEKSKLVEKGFFNIPVDILHVLIDPSQPKNIRFHWVPFHHFQLTNWREELKSEGARFPQLKRRR